MALYSFKLPDIGEGIAEAEIVAWHVKVGDMVKEDQQIADMMTDKATVEMESPVAGRVVKVAGEVGDQIAIGSVLVVFETEADAEQGGADQDGTETEAGERTDTVALGDGLITPTQAQEAAVPSTAEEPTSSSAPRPTPIAPTEVEEPVQRASSSSGERASTSLRTNEGEGDTHSRKPQILASPAVRQRARDLGIDLAEVKSTGDRLRHSDLDAYLLYNNGAVARSGAPRRQDEAVRVVGLRRKIAENMAEAKRRIPHFTLVEEFDVTALEQTRAMMNADRGSNPKLTMLPFLIVAMAKTLADYPQINARYDDDENVVYRSGAVNMGMATQTPNGLMVPVIRSAETMSVWEIASEILRLADAARTGKASRDELSGSTITISSLGPMGGITSTPVINRPEVAIIAVNKLEEKPVVIDGDLQIRKRMNLSLSCDHRVVDGWDAASFLQDMKKLIENPLKLLSL
ncbi:dihydrolipoamide acetyltransferase family protein [Allosphingosinicella deserti]|uniref:Dihydrolipoamide acetyltransferase component of pyruvate dehydrogenase complex n=1 Tax=Allosphingosinicella deserti TaxID=2116704 RepID=A0A2P7QSB7_9SPHN|nr:dihydrolipoamide acetyltransferase family protein [Sphingomonas deserti]PSJ40849.1 branched-chain alpha-keto acid dehydrogenase subunit E2 [Sphingomonas deserti]